MVGTPLPRVPDFVLAAPAEATKHAEERRNILRILVLHEAVAGVRRRVGLEPCGRMRVDYAGLVPELPFFQQWSAIDGLSPEELYQKF
jgi:hypothetical protein